MRTLIPALLLTGGLLAQTPDSKRPEATQPTPHFQIDRATAMRMSEQQYVKPKEKLFLAAPGPRADAGKLTLKPGQPCAVPLKKALAPSPNPDPKMIVNIAPQSFPVSEVVLPAPSCDDVK
jgi:hypothetical protein